MAKKSKNTTKKITNRRASYDYQLSDSFTAGIVLTGRETKSLRLGHGHIRGAYITFKNNELWLINSTITGSKGIAIDETEQTRDRKLLVKKNELKAIVQAKNQGLSIIPTEILTGQRYIKLRLSLGRGKKHYDKRQVIKKRDQNRSNEIELQKSNY